MIVSSGYNISGAEVENVLLAHPSVAECAVVGVPDEARGQIVKAFVVPARRRRAVGRAGQASCRTSSRRSSRRTSIRARSSSSRRCRGR